MTDIAGRPPAAGWVEGLTARRAEPARDGLPPGRAVLDRIIASVVTVPDHGGLRPWRFALVTDGGREQFGDALVAGLHQLRGPDVPEAAVAKMRGKAFAAPCAVVLIASPDATSNVPVWEQEASAACTGYAIVLAAAGLGYGAVWKSASVLESDAVRSLFDLTEDERLLGWVNLGSPGPVRSKRLDPGPDDLAGRVMVIDEKGRPVVD